MNTYDVGDVVLLRANFKVSGFATDPTTLQCFVKAPNGNITTLTYGVDAALIKDTVGYYHAEYTITQQGTHYVKWLTTGTAAGEEENTFYVRKSNFP